MKVCFFGTYSPTYSRVQILKKGLLQCGHKPLEVNLDLSLIELTASKHVGPVQIFYRLLRKLKFLPVIIKNIPVIQQSDVLFVTYPGHLDIPIAWLVAKIFHKKLIFDPTFAIYSMLVTDFVLIKPQSFLAKFVLLAERMLYKLPDSVIADTPYQRDFYIDTFYLSENKVQVLPIGADDDIYKFSEYKVPEKEFVVTFYGMFNPLHGTEYILEAAHRLQSDPSVKFVMVGSGQTYPQARQLAAKWGLKNVVFYPDMREAQALITLQQTDIFLGFMQKSPSVSRQIPNKVYQGLSLGKVIVTVHSEAIESVFEDRRDIYLVSPADAQSLTEAILDLKSNQSLRKKIEVAGHNMFIERFTSKVVANKLLELARSL